MHKPNNINISIIRMATYCPIQCAAVMTHSELRRAPPQKNVSAGPPLMETSHGHTPAAMSKPEKFDSSSLGGQSSPIPHCGDSVKTQTCCSQVIHEVWPDGTFSDFRLAK